MAGSTSLTFLLDSNAFIALEPFAGTLESLHSDLADTIRVARAHGHRVVVHPANEDDLRRTADPARRAQNLGALRKYESVPEPAVSESLREVFANPAPGSNDHRDMRLTAAVVAGVATHLVTADEKLIRRASRAGLGDRILRARDALDLLAMLHPQAPDPPPTVEATDLGLLDLHQEIFDTLRADYSGFDDWIRGAAADGRNRLAWIIRDPRGDYRAIAIVKVRDDHPISPATHATKLSTFKVVAESKGEKLGELLLKAVLNWASETRAERLFVTVRDDDDPAKASLIYFLSLFGFERIGTMPTDETELVFEKRLRPDGTIEMSALEHHIAYGPPAISGTGRVYAVPIVPMWFNDLFPDAPTLGAHGAQTIPGLSLDTQPFGNALRKAYLCHSNVTRIEPGATLLFYRSAGDALESVVQAVGVVESTQRSASPASILAFVGRRTVYTADEVSRMCQHDDGRPREVLAILFRQDRFVNPPWTLDLMRRHDVMKKAPQSIAEIKSTKRVEWVHQQLGV